MTMETNGSNPSSDDHKNQPSGNSTSANNKSVSNEKSNEKDVFVNHAEIAWHERRKEWVGDDSKKLRIMSREPIMSWTTTYEDLLLSSEPFYKPIPLAEMVDFLVDIWQDEGLYD